MLTLEQKLVLGTLKNHLMGDMRNVEKIRDDYQQYNADNAQTMISIRYLGKLAEKLQDCQNVINAILIDSEDEQEKS